MSSRTNKPTKKTNSKSPIRVVVRCAGIGVGGGAGGRLNVPSTPSDPIFGTTTLLQILERLRPSLPASVFPDEGGVASSSASLVCLRKVVPQSEWGATTLKQILEGDDGSAGVVLTLDLGASSYGSNSAGSSASNPVKKVIESAASSLNIKPVPMSSAAATAPGAPAAASSLPGPEPMEISNFDDSSQIQAATSTLTPDQAWSQILQSNFDATTKSCLITLIKIIDNLLTKPTDTKVRSIRCANPAFEKKVGSCKGGIQFLLSMGFVARYPVLGSHSNEPETLELTPENERKELILSARKVLVRSATVDLNLEEEDLPPAPKLPDAVPSSALKAPPPSSLGSTSASNTSSRGPTSGFNVYKTHSYNIQSAAMGAPDPYSNASSTMSTTERQLQQLQSKKSKLEKQMQKEVEMDRQLVAYRAGSGPTGINSGIGSGGNSGGGSFGGGSEGKGDSSLVAARMKRMEEERKKREEGGFTTKAMRDLEKMKKSKVYSHAQIRVNFPDGTHLHARFLPSEKVSSIRTILESSFHSSQSHLNFDLYVAPPRRLLDDEKTLDQEELVPAAKIHVSWKVGGSPTNDTFLRPELFTPGDTSGASFPNAKPVVEERKAASAQPSSGKGGNGNNNNGGQTKEELLMQRMLGKSSGLLGGKGSSSSKKSSSDGTKKDSKPKWFKS